MAKPDKFLFVSGCPRSGTTVMTTLLNWHDSVLVTQERYAPLLKFHPEQFVPDLFEPDRLLDFRKGECGYASFAKQKEHSAHYANPKDFSAIGSYPLRGDKITHLYRNVEKFEEPAWQDADVVVLHMMRNLDDVVCSYETRRLNQDDPWKEGIDQAVDAWSASVEDIHRYIGRQTPKARVGIVGYEKMFAGDAAVLGENLARVYAFVGIDFGDRQAEGIAKVHQASSFFAERRKLHSEATTEARRRVSAETLRMFERLRELEL